MARFKAEDEADAAKEAAKKARGEAMGVAVAAEPAPAVKEEPKLDDAKKASLDVLDMAEAAVNEPPVMKVENAETTDADEEVEEAEEAEIVEEEVAEVVEKPNFDNDENGKEKTLIYDAVSDKGRITLSELQSVPGLVDIGRMDITKMLNLMIKDGNLKRLEESDNIYFALPNYDPTANEKNPGNGQGLSPEEQYKIDMERYELALKQWKKSKRACLVRRMLWTSL